ncbi:MAG: transglutaminaseTgpA domain-containing protein [Paenibacillus dendritiformis]|uniref:transglutaminase TgpA family protein n=1 Tax=uncultured Paenibacillus sp. TaxID=227322 RepID=UPI0025EA0AA3|nr:transglutaminase domain-containing protein [uncultured Paenibacillus sp.]MDU5141398.1 transglutaminaseTgpA domain-containing protein [Paenibacillus dendritiformis]
MEVNRQGASASPASSVPSAPPGKIKRWLQDGWSERLFWTCLAVMVWQWIVMLEPYWYDETIAMSIDALLIIWGVSVLFPRQFFGRLFIGLPLVMRVIYMELARNHLWIEDGAGWERLQAFHPYIWFVVGIWLCYEALNQIVRGTGRIIMWLLIQVIVFGILDSFTEDILWDQVAWIVGAALVWLIGLHFSEMKDSYPEMKRTSLRYLLQMAASGIVVIALIITVGVNMPGLEPILTDPYTAWTNRNGTGGNFVGRIVSNVTGTGTGTGTPTPTTSGYSNHDSQLGAGFQMDYEPVMTVTSEARGYWRGEAKDIYTGQGWVDANRELSLEPLSIGERFEADDAPAKRVRTKEIIQKVQIQSDQIYPVLFGMYSVSAVEELEGGDTDRLIWNGRESEIRYEGRGAARYPASYTIVSHVPIISEEELRAALPAEAPDSVYLQLPDRFPERVADLARTLTEGETNNYDKAKKIEQYLRTQFTYTNAPDLSKRTSSDFVEGFLFEIKEGYCDYFSTSMAVMLRSVGVPARWVKGYAPGAREGADHQMMTGSFDPDEGGRFRVTNADAHSWVEVYMGEYGWVSFEPTPGFSMPNPEHGQEQEPDTPPEQEEEKQPEVKEEKKAGKPEEERPIPAWVVTAARSIVGAALLGLLAWLVRLWGQAGFSPRWLRTFRRRISPRDRVVLETELWLSYCRLRGLRKEPHETVREAALRWSEGRPQLEASLQIIVPMFEQAKYSGEPLDQADVARFREAVRQFRRVRKR